MKETAEKVTMRFSDWLKEHRKGSVDYDLSEALQEVVQGVRETGGTGKLTLELTVKPIKGNRNLLQVSDKVTGKPPAAEREAGVWYAREDGGLQRDDPRQQTFEME